MAGAPDKRSRLLSVDPVRPRARFLAFMHVECSTCTHPIAQSRGQGWRR
jgi:hypothetical protein